MMSDLFNFPLVKNFQRMEKKMKRIRTFKNNSISRRKFIKTVSAFAGGVLAFNGLNKSTALAQNKSSKNSKEDRKSVV